MTFGKTMKSPVHRFWKYGAIILALGFAGSAFENWRIKKTLAGIYRYSIEVTVLDATTGRPLDNITIQAPGISTADLFQQTSGMSGGHDGTVGISGIAYEPRQWSFGRDGYRGASIIVDDSTDPSQTVKLEPIQEAEQAGSSNGG